MKRTIVAFENVVSCAGLGRRIEFGEGELCPVLLFFLFGSVYLLNGSRVF